jgi:tryptophan synthase alpha chain
MGVTGTRASVGEQAADLVRRTRAADRSGRLPVCVGLGVSNAEQAKEVAGFADGVIVGSAFVQRILDAAGDEAAGLTAVRELAGELARGVCRDS